MVVCTGCCAAHSANPWAFIEVCPDVHNQGAAEQSTHYAIAIIHRIVSSNEAAYVLKDKGRLKIGSSKGC